MKPPPKHVLKSSNQRLHNYNQQHEYLSIFSKIANYFVVKICPTVIKILTFSKWS